MTTPALVLENSAGSGDGMGSTIEDLAAILDALDKAGAPMARIGICLDTAHLWGAGHEVSRPDVADELLVDSDRSLGPERLMMLHINDSKAALGSHLDRHEHIGAGRIGEVGMRHLFTHPRLSETPMFLETPGMDDGCDAINMARVRASSGDPLATRRPKHSPSKRAMAAHRWLSARASAGTILRPSRPRRCVGATGVLVPAGGCGAVRCNLSSRSSGTKRLYERAATGPRLVT